MTNDDYDKFKAVQARVARLLADCYPHSLGERSGVLALLLAETVYAAAEMGVTALPADQLLERSMRLVRDVYNDLQHATHHEHDHETMAH